MAASRSTVPVTAIMTAYRRVDAAIETLGRIRQCEPQPAEILVHVDGGERACAAAVERAFPDIRVLVSDSHVGPGGGRNKLIAAATHPIVASFDDDSYPIDRDYFARLRQVFAEFPEAWVVDAHVSQLNQPIEPDADHSEWVADFSGGGCAYDRARVLQVGGFVPLPAAYGMEEVDLGLRLHAMSGRVLRSRRLRVFHNTDLARHADASVTAASIVNIALLTYLRYPRWLWAVGAAQCVKRIGWLMSRRRFSGLLSGVAGIPAVIARHRGERAPVTSRALRSYWSLRRHSVPAHAGPAQASAS
jgi:GT2 family glycosyltransferase